MAVRCGEQRSATTPALSFSTWYDIGCYGGLLCALVTATSTAGYALLRRRGTPRQLAIAMLICLASAVLILPAAVWDQLRLQLVGPSLSEAEVAFWLSWVALTGWVLPLTCAAAYVLLAAPPSAARRSQPARMPAPAHGEREPLGAGVPWAWLTALDGPFKGRRLTLTKETISLGRHIENDICIDTDLASRHHARLFWDHGRGYLMDCESLNGTMVNGQRIWTPALLQTGDVVSAGGRSFRFELAHTAPDMPPIAADTAVLGTVVPGQDHAVASAELVVEAAGQQPGQRFPLRALVTTLGRDPENTIVLADASVSRRHAQIVRQQQGDYLEDLESRNGTFVNGTLLTAPQLLQPGDEIRLGALTLRYHCERVALPAATDGREHDQETVPSPTPITLPDQDTNILRLPPRLGLPLRSRPEPPSIESVP